MALYPGDVYLWQGAPGGPHFYVVVSALRFNNKYVTVVPTSSAGFDKHVEYDQTVIVTEDDAPCFGDGSLVHPEGITTILADRLGSPRNRLGNIRARMPEIVAAIGKVICATCTIDELEDPDQGTLEFPE